MLRLLVLRRKRDCLDDNVVDRIDTLEWYGNPSKFILSNELCVLDWWGYPLSSLPRSFQADNLFMLRMPSSSIKQLWHGGKIFEKLRYIDVHNSQHLMKTPDFSGVPNVEELDLSFCTSLSKVCSSIKNLRRLIYLSLRGCKSLEKLPKEISLESLKGLDLFGCSRLKNFPKTLSNMASLQVLGVDRTTMEKLGSSFFNSSSLKCLAISHDGYLKSVKMFNGDASLCMDLCRLYNDPHSHTFSFSNWPMGLGSLISLDLSCLDLSDEALPRDISYLSSLKNLDISWNRFTKVPQCVSQLPNLEDLNLNSCQLLQSLSIPLPSKLSYQSFPIERRIHLENCNLLDGAILDDLGYLSLASTLSLGSNKFTKLPDSFCQISNLECLLLEDCQWLKALPKLPLSLCSLDIRNSPLLEIYDCHTDEWTSNSKTEPWTSVWYSVATNIGYDDIPFKILQVLLGCPLREGWIYHVAVPWGPTLRCQIPSWFNQKSTTFFGAIHSHVDIVDLDLEDWIGYAMFVVYEVYGHGNSNSRIFRGSNPTFPKFVCQAQADGISLERPGVLCVPEVPYIGRNGFWVYLPAEMFREWRTDLLPSHYLGVSIATSSLNVEIKECGSRLIREGDVSEFFDVLSNITPHGLELKQLEEFELEVFWY